MATGVAAVAVAALLPACGGSSPASEESGGTYDVRVTEAEFPTDQQLGETTQMRLGVRNSGDRALPALTVTVSIAGRQGSTSSLPFGVRDRQPGLAQPDRPVWVLSAGYPKLRGTSGPGGTSTANPKTFNFGPLKPGREATAIWQLSAVKPGRYVVTYRVNAGLTGSAKVRTAGGVAPGGSFAVDVDSEPLDTEVTDDGRVVPIAGGEGDEREDAGGPRARVVPRAAGE